MTAADPWTADSPARILTEYDRVLAREAHHLVRRPDLLPQQLLNELQWADPPIAAVVAGIDERMRAPAAPWIHRRNPLRQSGALDFVLDAGSPTSVVVGPRGNVVAAGGADGNLTVWDAGTGRQQNSAVVSPGYPPFLAGDPDFRVVGVTGRGDLVCLEDRASILRIRDVVTLEIRDTLEHATWDIRACAVTESRSFVLLDTRAGLLRAWAPEGTWTERDGAAVVAAAIDNGLIASVSAAAEVTVRDARWCSVSVAEPFVADTTRWQAPPRSAGVVACAVSEHLRAVLLAYADGTLWIGDAGTGQEHGTLDAGLPAATSCALGPDFVVVGDSSGTVRVLDLRTLEARFAATVGGIEVTACAVSPDGSLVVCGGVDGTLTLLDATMGTRRGGFTATTGAIRACGVSAEGDAVVAATDRGCLEGWWHESGTKWFVQPGPYEIRAATTNLTGDYVCAVTADAVLRVWATGTASERAVERAVELTDGPAVTCAAMAPAGDRVLLGAEDGSLRLVDARSGEEIARGAGHAKAVTCCAIGPDGRRAFSGGADGALKRWDLPDLAERFSIAAHQFAVGSCAIAPDGRYLVTGAGGTAFGGPAKIWDTESGDEIGVLEGWDDENPACAVSPDAGVVVTVGRSKHVVCLWRTEHVGRTAGPTLAPGPPLCAFGSAGEVVFFGRFDQLAALDPGTARPVFDVGDLPEDVWVCAVSPDGRALVTGGREGTVRLWDARTGEPGQVLTPTVGVTESWLHREQCLGLAVSPTGDLVFSSEFGGGTRVWNLRTGAEWLIGSSGRLTPDAATLAVQSEDEDRISYLDIGTGDPVRMSSGRLGIPLPDWSAFLSCADGTLRMWDAGTGADRGSVPVHEKEAHVAAVTPDGRYVVTGSDDRTVRVTRLEDLTTIATIPTLASVESLDLHPWLPLAAVGDFTGNLYLLDLVGIDYGPIYRTAVDEGTGPVLPCPRCATATPLSAAGAGEIRPCPTPGCGLMLRATGFTARPFLGEPSPQLRRGMQVPRMGGLAGALARSVEARDDRIGQAVPTVEWTPPSAHSRRRQEEPADLLTRLQQWAGDEPPPPSRWKRLFGRH